MNIPLWLPSGDSRAKNFWAIILSSLGLFLKLFAKNLMMYLKRCKIQILNQMSRIFSFNIPTSIKILFCELFEPQYNFGFLSCESEISTIVRARYIVTRTYSKLSFSWYDADILESFAEHFPIRQLDKCKWQIDIKLMHWHEIKWAYKIWTKIFLELEWI